MIHKNSPKASAEMAQKSTGVHVSSTRNIHRFLIPPTCIESNDDCMQLYVEMCKRKQI